MACWRIFLGGRSARAVMPGKGVNRTGPSVCPTCVGTGLVTQHHIELDGFHYYPLMGLFYGKWNLHFTPAEAKVCAALMLRPGHVVSVDGLMQFVGTEANTDHIISHWVSLARTKIRNHCGLEPIQTSIGYGGYFWQLDPIPNKLQGG